MSLEVKIIKKLNNFTLNVSFICENEIFALLGASGCGKSMTLKCIAGIETPDRGRIVLDGRVLFDSDLKINIPPQKRNIGYLFQQYALFPTMTVAQNIASGMKGKNRLQRKKLIKYYIKTMQLNGLNNKYPAQLSGGQQQRVALARILASSPSVILLDEPFSSLDSFLKWQLEMQLSDTLNEFNGSVIWVSHDRNEVFRNCNRICVIDNGKSGQTNFVKELFKNPVTVSAARLTGCKNFIKFDTIDERRIYIPDWNTFLYTNTTPAENHRYAGICAHWIHSKPEIGDNIIRCSIERITEDPFFIILMLKPVDAFSCPTQLRLEIEKNDDATYKLGDTITIGIDPADIMLLE